MSPPACNSGTIDTILTLLAQVFVAVEDNRAGSLRQDRSWRANLPPDYWEVLAQTRRLEIAALTHDPGVTPEHLQKSRARLSELESSAGLFSQEKAERIPPNQALSNFRQMLHPGEALASFQLGDGESFAWVLTSTHLELSRLPGRRTIAEAVRRLSQRRSRRPAPRPLGLAVLCHVVRRLRSRRSSVPRIGS